MDPLATPRIVRTSEGSSAYSHLITEKTFVGEEKAIEYVGELAESYELADGGTKLIVKLRPNGKFDPRPPTNGRIVDSDDVLFSWNKYISLSPYAAQLYNTVAPSAPVTSVDKIDAQTVRFNLAFPWSPLLPTLSWGQLIIEPREADGGFNPKNETRGSGAWYLKEWNLSQSYVWRRNPTFYDSTYPLLDGYDTPIIIEPAARLAQFRAKQIWDITPNPSDVVQIANELQDAGLYLAPNKSTTIRMLSFGNRTGSPWRDERLRQATAYSIDRDAYSYTQSGADIYEKAGIPFPVSLGSSVMTDAWGDFYLDPRGKEIGDGAKYFTRNIPEAKKLMSAGGFPDGMDQIFHSYPNGGGVTTDGTILGDMLSEIGVRTKIEMHDFNSDYMPNILVAGTNNKGNYDGIAIIYSAGSNGDCFNFAYQNWHSKGAYTASRRWDATQDKLDALYEQAFREFDHDKQKQIAWQIQRETASYQGAVQYMYASQPFTLAWNWVKNFRAHKTSVGMPLSAGVERVWIDESLKTS